MFQPTRSTLGEHIVRHGHYVFMQFYVLCRYFYAAVLQFQMYRSFCIEAKKFDPNNASGAPLHQCDFYGSTDAGDKLKYENNTIMSGSQLFSSI